MANLNQEQILNDAFLNRIAKIMPKAPRDGDFITFFKEYLGIEEYEIQNEDPYGNKSPKQLALKLLVMWKERTPNADVDMLFGEIDKAVEDGVFSCKWHRGGMYNIHVMGGHWIITRG